jgi:hypothetical protein
MMNVRPLSGRVGPRTGAWPIYRNGLLPFFWFVLRPAITQFIHSFIHSPLFSFIHSNKKKNFSQQPKKKPALVNYNTLEQLPLPQLLIYSGVRRV